jgi:uncharacterized protein (DUF58 family)
LLQLAAGLVAVGLLAFFWRPASWLVPVALVAVFVLAARDLRDLRRAMKSLCVDRFLPVAARRGTPFNVTLRLRASNLTLAGEVRDLVPADAQPPAWTEPFTLPAGGEIVLAHAVTIPVRGLHAFGPVWVRLQGPRGFLEMQKPFDCKGAVKVLPDHAGADEELLKDALAERRLLDEISRTRLRGEGTEFESLSEYRHGDDPRRIDWRASARHDRLIVRRFQVEQHRDLVILIDCGRLMGTESGAGTKLDCAIDSALLLARVAVERGDRCGVGLFDDQVLGYLPPLTGTHALRTITESIYNAQSRWRESNFSAMFATLQHRRQKRSLVIVLSDIVDPETSERLRTALASLVHKHVVVFAALRTPFLGELLGAPVEAIGDVERKAVVLRLLREREKALHLLDRSGIHIVDVEPRELTIPLVNRYIAIRQRNLI